MAGVGENKIPGKLEIFKSTYMVEMFDNIPR